jgi:hypothetical protein
MQQRETSKPLLSDHTGQQGTVRYYGRSDGDKPTLEFSVFTLNLADRYTEMKIKNAAGVPLMKFNNPYHTTEDAIAYRQRKQAQIEMLIQKMDAGVDFICLQEADFLTQLGGNNNDKRIFSPVAADLKTQFLKKIEAKNYGIIIPNPDMNEGEKLQHNVIIYTKSKWEINSKKDMEPLFGVKKISRNMEYINYRGLGQEFRSLELDKDGRKIKDGRRVNIVSYHGDYDNKTHDSDMRNYLTSQINSGVYTVVAGDTNHSSNDETYKLSNRMCATNFARDENDDYKLIDKNSKTISDFDGFFVSPTENTKAEFSLTECEQFIIRNGEIMIISFMPQEKLTFTSDFKEPCLKNGKRTVSYLQEYPDVNDNLPEIVIPEARDLANKGNDNILPLANFGMWNRNESKDDEIRRVRSENADLREEVRVLRGQIDQMNHGGNMNGNPNQRKYT